MPELPPAPALSPESEEQDESSAAVTATEPRNDRARTNRAMSASVVMHVRYIQRATRSPVFTQNTGTKRIQLVYVELVTALGRPRVRALRSHQRLGPCWPRHTTSA